MCVCFFFLASFLFIKLFIILLIVRWALVFVIIFVCWNCFRFHWKMGEREKKKRKRNFRTFLHNRKRGVIIYYPFIASKDDISKSDRNNKVETFLFVEYTPRWDAKSQMEFFCKCLFFSVVHCMFSMWKSLQVLFHSMIWGCLSLFYSSCVWISLKLHSIVLHTQFVE